VLERHKRSGAAGSGARADIDGGRRGGELGPGGDGTDTGGDGVGQPIACHRRPGAAPDGRRRSEVVALGRRRHKVVKRAAAAAD
jgi:hypothetical protein